jgi:hypothetical protein
VKKFASELGSKVANILHWAATEVVGVLALVIDDATRPKRARRLRTARKPRAQRSVYRPMAYRAPVIVIKVVR